MRGITPSGSEPAAGPVRIGLIADTHVGEWRAVLPTAVLKAFRGVQLILHAGDLTDRSVIEQLGSVAPVYAVEGDHDRDAGIVLPRARVIDVGGRRVGLTHGRRWRGVELAAGAISLVCGRPVLLGLHRALRRRFGAVDVIVYGHLHLAEVRTVDGVLFVNPGAVHNPERAAGFAAAGFAARRYLRFRRRLPEEAAAPSVAILTIDGPDVTVDRVVLAG